MQLRDKLMADVKTAMVAKDSLKLGTLRFLQSAIKYREIELRPEPINDEEVMGVIKKLVKQRKESIDQYQAANRQDLVDQESKELAILMTYLPTQMSKEQIEKLVTDVIQAVGAKTMKDMGGVMKESLARAGGQADNKLLSEVIKAKLQA